MPHRLAKPCCASSCPALTHGRFCDTHRQAEYRRQNEQRGSTRERGYAGAWFALRKQVLERDAHRCARCGGHANTVDHIVAKTAGGTDEPFNLQSLCRACHSAKTMRESVSRGR